MKSGFDDEDKKRLALLTATRFHKSKPDFDYFSYLRDLSQKYHINQVELLDILFNAQNAKKKSIRTIELASGPYTVTKHGCGPLDTSYGRFHHMVFTVNDQWQTYHVIAKAPLNNDSMQPTFDEEENVFLRIDSGCTTGQLFHDKTCECREQLELAMQKLAQKKQGLIIHIPGQDGRGKGINFKLATLYLQDRLGVNTIEAFTLLEKNNADANVDCRTYDGTIAILKFLDLKSKLILGTNNPKKMDAITKNGFIVESEPIVIAPTELTAHHLEAKKVTLGHNFEGLQ